MTHGLDDNSSTDPIKKESTSSYGATKESEILSHIAQPFVSFVYPMSATAGKIKANDLD
jgi:hypothetical protein